MPRPRPGARSAAVPRRYQRTDRLNEVLREVLAEELERIGDDDDVRLRLLTVTGIDCSTGLEEAIVFYATLGDEAAAAEALEAMRHRLQKAVASQVRARRTPILRFVADPGVLAGRRMDSLLREIPLRPDEVPVDPANYREPRPAAGALDDPGGSAGDGVEAGSEGVDR